MAEKLEDQWHTRDLPVLIAVIKHFDDDVRPFLNQALTVPEVPDSDAVVRALIALGDEHIDINRHDAMGRRVPHIMVRGVRPAGRRAAGVWPDAEAATDRLIWALERQIEDTAEPDKRGKLVKIRDAFASAGREISVGVLTEVVNRQITG